MYKFDSDLLKIGFYNTTLSHCAGLVPKCWLLSQLLTCWTTATFLCHQRTIPIYSCVLYLLNHWCKCKIAAKIKFPLAVLHERFATDRIRLNLLRLTEHDPWNNFWTNPLFLQHTQHWLNCEVIFGDLYYQMLSIGLTKLKPRSRVSYFHP